MQERQTLTNAQDMLRKLGYTGNLLEASAAGLTGNPRHLHCHQQT